MPRSRRPTPKEVPDAVTTENIHEYLLARDFLREVWGEELPARTRLLLWALATKRSHWYADTDAAAAEAADRIDWYMGCGLVSEADAATFGASQRGEAKHVVAIPGLWLDIDIAGPAHKKTNLPPSVEAAEVLAAYIAPPSLLVHSGHGLQAWWLFKEPWVFDHQGDREKARLLAAGWHRLHWFAAKHRDWTIDNVSDLSRVMRLPGTWNGKVADDVCRVTIHPRNAPICQPGPRYNPDDLAARVEATEGRTTANGVAPASTTVVPSAAARPAGNEKEWIPGPDAVRSAAVKLDVLVENDSRFAKTWRHTRRDLSDSSPSGWEMAICCQLARTGFTPDEMAAAIQMHRERWFPAGLEKARRRDYIERTIAKAVEQAQRPHGGETATNVAAYESQFQTEDGTPSLATKLGELREMLGGLPIARVIRQGRAETLYSLQLEGGYEIILGRNLFDQHGIKLLVANWSKQSLGEAIVLPTIKSVVWEQSIVKRIVDLSESSEAGEGEPEILIAGYVRQYLATTTVYDQEMMAEAVPRNMPFRKNGEVWLSLTRFHEWLMKRRAILKKDLPTYLRIAGFEYRSVSVRVPKRGTVNRGYWHGQEYETEETENQSRPATD